MVGRGALARAGPPSPAAEPGARRGSGDPPYVLRIPPRLGNCSGMAFYRRRLPHIYDLEHPIFLTWRLDGSLPPNRAFPPGVTSGNAFAAMDRLLDQARAGPFYLRQPAIADMLVEATPASSGTMSYMRSWSRQTTFTCWLIPTVALPKLTKSLN